MEQRRGTAAILAVAVALLLAAGLAAHGRHAVVDEREFADRAEAALARPDVREEVALRLQMRLVAQHPELRPAKRVLATAIADVVRDRRFDSAFRAGAVRMHGALFDGSGAVRLELPGAMPMVHSVVERRAPAFAEQLPAAAAPPLMTLGGGGTLERALRRVAPAAGVAAAWWPVALGLALALLVFALVRTRDRPTLRVLGVATAAAGAVALVGTVGVELVLLSTFTSRHGDAVVDAIWDSYMTDVRTGGLIAVATGLALAAATTGSRSGKTPS